TWTLFARWSAGGEPGQSWPGCLRLPRDLLRATVSRRGGEMSDGKTNDGGAGRTVTISEGGSDPFDRLAEEFAEQCRRGESPSIVSHPCRRDVERRDRCQREAQAVARIHHTSIVPSFGVGEHEGLPYYVMQYIPGRGLDVLLGEWRRGGSAGDEDRRGLAAQV